MLFSIIIATHDRPLLLKRTLQSLIDQTCQDFRVVVVSDSASYLPPYPELSALEGRFVFMIRSGQPGPAISRDMGMAVADGDYWIFLDDDDCFCPGHLQALQQRLQDAQQARPELLFCDFQVQQEDRSVSPPQPLNGKHVSLADVTSDSLYVLNRIPNSCVAYRRDVLAGVRHDTGLVIYEDWDFLLAAMAGRRLEHLASSTVVIHTCAATAPQNMRRGNSRNENVLAVTLQLYQRHPAPNLTTRLARQALLAKAGVPLGLEYV